MTNTTFEKKDVNHNPMKRLARRSRSAQIMTTCPHCRKTTGSINYKKYHGDRCKFKK